MNEKMTRVSVSDGPGYMLRGHVTYSQAVADATRYFESQLREAQNALESIREGTIRVTHQRGIYRSRDIHQIHPNE